MKDLKVFDDSIIQVATLRCEMLSTDAANFEILEIKDGNGQIQDSIGLAGKVWQKLPYSFADLKTAVQNKSWSLNACDTNGDNEEVVIPPSGR